MTHASRNTTTGLAFEQYITIKETGINLTKNELYNYLKKKKINWETLISRKLLPDEAYFNPSTGELHVYEKKFQQTAGSADEKIQTCAFKILQYRKLGKAIGATKVTYTYLLSKWFEQPMYKDVLDYIKTVDGCDYIIVE